MKKWVWSLHSWVGLLAGIGLIAIGVSGSALVFKSAVDAFLGQSEPAITPGLARAPLDLAVDAALARHPDLEIYAWYANEDPARADRLAGALTKSGRDLEINFDPHTGALLESNAHQGAFSGWLLRLHTSLFLGPAGELLAGTLAAALVLSGLTGIYLYREFWRRLFTLRWRASARIYFSSLHKTVGISSVAFNLILGFTGAYWNLPVLGHLLASPASAAAPSKYVLPPRPMPLEVMIAAAGRELPGYVPRGLRFPAASDDFYVVRGGAPTANPFVSGWGDEISLEPVTGDIEKVLDLRKAGAWARFEDMMTPLHYGTFGGLPIKILWCLGGLTPGVLAVSGFLIWRLRGHR